jgi:MFS family permease
LEPPHFSEQERRAFAANLRKFYLFRFLVDFQLWLPIWVIYLQKERGLSLSEVTALDAPFWIVLVVMEVPTGAIADRWGRKASLSCGAFANASAVLVFGIADSYVVILASYLIWAVAWTLYSGADTAFFFDSLKALGRESEFQKLWGRARAIQSSGALLGLALGAPLAAATNLWFPVVASAGLIAAAGLVSLTFHEPPHLEKGERQLSYLEGTKEAARIAFGTPQVRYMMLLAASVTAIATSISILSQPFLDSHGVDVDNFGWFLVPGSLVGIASALAAYRLTGGFGLQRVIAALPLLVIAAAAGLGAWDSLGAFAFYPLNAIALSLSIPVVGSYLNQRIPSSRRATILSFHQLLFSLLIAGIEPALGTIAQHAGLPVAYQVAGILLAVASAPLLALWIRASRGESTLRESNPEPAPAA